MSSYFAYPVTYDGELAVMYYTGGTIYYHVGGDLTWRNNNPGNCVSGSTSKQFNEIGTNKGFAIFPSYFLGNDCLYYVVFTVHAGKTIKQLMESYAPPSENDTEKYISFIENSSGLSRNTVVDKLSSSQRTSLLNALKAFEGTATGKVVNTNIYPV